MYKDTKRHTKNSPSTLSKFPLVVILLLLVPLAVVFVFTVKQLVFRQNTAQPSSITPYLNTLLVDHITFPSNLSDIKFDMQQSPSFLKKRILHAEKVYQTKIKLRNDWIASHNNNDSSTSTVNPWNRVAHLHIWNYFPPAFNCPHMVERVGRLGDGGKWICGLDLFELSPRPQECVVYTFGNNGGDNALEKELLARTDCHLYSFDMNKSPYSHPRMEVFNSIKISDKNSQNQKTLEEILKSNDHAWVDILMMDIEGRELQVLEEIMESYDVLPFGQLQVEFHLPDDDPSEMFHKFFKWFERLEKKGLRPFYTEANLDGCIFGNKKKPTVVEYSFVNVRGKHLLMTGK